MQWWGYPVAGVASLAAGVVNSLVGGGTLVTFPVLIGLGVPSVAANMTNTVALCSGHLSSARAQASVDGVARARLMALLVAGGVGGLVGGVLLRMTSDAALRLMVPGLLGLATLAMAMQPWLRARLGRHAATPDRPLARWLVPVIGVVSVYGGYFGAGLGVLLLAALGLGMQQSLHTSNAVKQWIALVVNVVAAVFFVFAGDVRWWLALVMAVGSWCGGAIGGRWITRLRPERFRLLVLALGATVSVVYAVKVWA